MQNAEIIREKGRDVKVKNVAFRDLYKMMKRW
jgi:hypothetical protein